MEPVTEEGMLVARCAGAAKGVPFIGRPPVAMAAMGVFPG